MTAINTAIGRRESAAERAGRLCRWRNCCVDRLNNAIGALSSAEAEYRDAEAAYESADHEYRLALAALGDGDG